MLGLERDESVARRTWQGTAVSVGIHAMVVLAVFGVLGRRAKLAPYRLPGTSLGLQSLTYYSPGSTQAASSDVVVKAAKVKPRSVEHAAMVAPAPDVPAAASAEKGVGSSGQSRLGDGNITIALQKYFPYPKPSLSDLPPGTKGDVILTAIIDEHGKIAELKLLQGLGHPIDDEVIATVDQWTYTPAMKGGVPVASVQELHFHYERRG